ncbi:MAG: glycoside hydrolase family 172 protein, partial [Verrucomicrobiia bacterium]
MEPFNGLGLHLGNLSRLSSAKSLSLSPENPTGEKGKGAMATEGSGARCAQELGRGWKIAPSIHIKPGETATIADIRGPGAIQQIWMTPTGNWRFEILRIYWDDQEQPSVEVPLGDFFGCGWGTEDGANHKGANFRPLSSLAVCVNPGSAFNCYWEMPFRKRCRITVENLHPGRAAEEAIGRMTLYYQVNYTLTEVPKDAAYFHAQWRRSNPLPYKEVHTLLDGVKGWGHYVGTSMAWGANNNGWWGEGEIKFFMDGDKEFPTICGTGTEDYFCGSYNFENKVTQQYQEFTGPYTGVPHIVRSNGVYDANMRFSLYRWHIPDPIRFERDLKVTIQALGWRRDGRFLPLQDDIASVAFWYQR